MINIEFDDKLAIENIEKRLEGFPEDAPKVLSRAINAAAKKAPKILLNSTKEKYRIKKPDFKNDMSITKSKPKKLVAFVNAVGGPLEIARFGTRPADPFKYLWDSSWNKTMKVRVMKDSGLKKIIAYGNKAFPVQFESGHRAIVVRKTNARYPIKSVYSVSFPQMLGNEEVQSQSHELISDVLIDAVDKEINKAIARRAK